MVKNFKMLLIALGSFVFAQGQDSTKTTTAAPVDFTKKTSPPVTITGSVDGYYRYNFNAPKKGATNNYTSFTNSQNSVELGMASIRADHSFGKVSATADLGFGRRAEEFSYNDGAHPTLFAVKQLFVTYSPASNLKFTAGKWATHFDCEVPDAYLDRNYSMSYLFSYGPFFHTGLKAELTAGKSLFMLGVANPTDYTTTTDPYKYIIAQFASGTKDDKFKFYLNYQGGKSNDTFRVHAFNLTAIYAFSPQFNITSNSSVKFLQNKTAGQWNSSQKWWGSALYLNADPVSWFGWTLRSEYFNDKENVLGFNGNVFEATLSGRFGVSNLTIIPELRLDNGSQEIFFKSDGMATTKSTFSALLAFVYKF